MPLDTSIALGVQTPQVQTINPMNIMDVMAQAQQRRENAQYNAMRGQLIQQEMQKNALAMQYGAEDRAIARAAAAQDLARKNQLLGIFGGYGQTPAVTGTRGASYSGTGVANDPNADIQTKLLQAGFPEQAKAMAELSDKGASAEKTRAETKGFDLKNIDTRLATIKSLVPMIDTAEGAANFSKLVTQIVPEFSAVAGDPNAAAMRNAEAFTKDPNAWRTQVSNLTAEQLVQAHERATKAAQPEPLAVSRGATIIDKNPSSPTYGQPIYAGQANTSEIPELKKGEVWNPKEQRVEASPGSDIYIQQSAKHGKDFGALNDLNTTTDMTTKTIDKILDPKNQAGFERNFGGYNAAFGTQYSPDAQDVKADIETLKSQLKTAGLKLIRQGGSIGAMTEKEWPIVQNMIDTLTPYMSEEKARDTLNEIKARVGAIRDTAKDTYETTWGNTQYYKEPGKKSSSGAAATSSKSIFDAADAILGGK